MGTIDNLRARSLRRTLIAGLEVLTVALAVATAMPLLGRSPASNSGAEPKARHWHKYSNTKHGFSFWYPEPYRPVSLPPPNEADKFRYYEKRLLLLERRDDPEAKIWIRLDVRPFDLHTLWQSHAPTGYDEDKTPAPTRIAGHIFYFYGPGGGGVDYPDDYFVNLRGKILEFEFDGPYREGKSPSGETPELEPKILKTFRVL